MSQKINLTLSPREASRSEFYLARTAQELNISTEQIALARVVKRSIDARSSRVKVNMSLEIFVDDEPQPEAIHFDYPCVRNASQEVVIVGGGPAALFAALRLIELKVKPIILERGNEVSQRKRDVAQINRGGEIDPNSNYAFGEGGAGTFSDGKLYTRSKKRGDYNKALQVLHFHGAQEEILFEAHPHIGTDRLPRVMRNIREQIIRAGGEVHFGRCVTDLKIDSSQRVRGVYCGDELIEGAAVILATGHSATDIYELLHKKDIALEAKAFAMGVRIEHPQQLIDKIQYSSAEGRGEYLPAASYSLVSQQFGRGVYSFCMCPGGLIVPAMTSAAESVVNGMSSSERNSRYANSGYVCEVRTSDFAHLSDEWGVLAGLKYQRELEQIARHHGGGANAAPAQALGDFVSGKKSASLPSCSYIPALNSSRIDKWLPEYMSQSLRAGLKHAGGRLRGFITNEALLLGVESRTSSPVRIPRDRDSLMHPTHSGLFPSGEGAGYAGGIISAALDGERVAEAVVQYIK